MTSWLLKGCLKRLVISASFLPSNNFWAELCFDLVLPIDCVLALFVFETHYGFQVKWFWNIGFFCQIYL